MSDTVWRKATFWPVVIIHAAKFWLKHTKTKKIKSLWRTLKKCFEVTHQPCRRCLFPWMNMGLTVSRGVSQGAQKPIGMRPLRLHYYRREASNRGDWSLWGGGDMTTGWGEGWRRSRGLARPGWWVTRWRKLNLWSQDLTTWRMRTSRGC